MPGVALITIDVSTERVAIGAELADASELRRRALSAFTVENSAVDGLEWELRFRLSEV
ncbi:MAG: hypothetical protein ACI8TX_000129 [Hyphomicrobiaceae bacterium]|jgi:hypothetical protein